MFASVFAKTTLFNYPIKKLSIYAGFRLFCHFSNFKNIFFFILGINMQTPKVSEICWFHEPHMPLKIIFFLVGSQVRSNK